MTILDFCLKKVPDVYMTNVSMSNAQPRMKLLFIENQALCTLNNTYMPLHFTAAHIIEGNYLPTHYLPQVGTQKNSHSFC